MWLGSTRQRLPNRSGPSVSSPRVAGTHRVGLDSLPLHTVLRTLQYLILILCTLHFVTVYSVFCICTRTDKMPHSHRIHNSLKITLQNPLIQFYAHNLYSTLIGSQYKPRSAGSPPPLSTMTDWVWAGGSMNNVWICIE